MEKGKIKIGIADDHPVSRKGIILCLNEFDEFEVIIEATNGKDLIEQIKQSASLPDVCFVDVKMPEMNGYETTKYLKENYPDVRVLAISMYDNDQVVIGMLRSGARGYLPKEAHSKEFRIAALSVYHDGYYYSDVVTDEIIDKISHKRKLKSELSDQEKEFLKYSCTDLTYTQIADKMQIGINTLDACRATLFKKLDIKSRSGLIVFAMGMGLCE